MECIAQLFESFNAVESLLQFLSSGYRNEVMEAIIGSITLQFKTNPRSIEIIVLHCFKANGLAGTNLLA